MQPKNDSSKGATTPNESPQSNPVAGSDGQQAALNIVRQQIDQLYQSSQPNEQIAAKNPSTSDTPNGATPTTMQVVETVIPEDSPYSQSHSIQDDNNAQIANIKDNSQWDQYHSAWQQYYQMYYDRYYQAQLDEKQKRNPNHAQPKTKRNDGSLTRNEAVEELRVELMQKVKHQTSKIRHSRHFMPLISASLVAIIFLFLQYNQLLFAQVKAFVSPGVVSSENILVTDPSASTQVGPEPRIIIPSINVDAPVVYDVTSLEEKYIDSKLKEGVVHYPIPGANAMPGQVGNSVILGHSSNDVFDDGKYKFIFVQLERLQEGDMFYLQYNGTRYTYKITEKKIIDPTQVSELVLDNSKPRATLVTCTPPGTALKRLLVIGDQINPDPSTATAVDVVPATETAETSEIGGAAQSFFERLFNMSF
ncbi:sortase [Candidatus Saccharibacteria bacterium]|nr:sortase [Candidatus Saccharibacteria bacterium]NCU40475.1 sortase [Candidatus Saccharibacteria bacterium]